MLPAHVRDLETAAFWITEWFEHVGALSVEPDDPVTATRERSGVIVETRRRNR